MIATVIIDPVCGTPVEAGVGPQATHAGRTVEFCSEACRRAFLEHPERFRIAGTVSTEGPPVPQEEEPAQIAYFSMEVGIDPNMPTYAGGLGVLAGDMLRSSADLEIPAVGVTLVSSNDYFEQMLDEAGRQTERRVRWNPATVAVLGPQRVTVRIEGRDVRLAAWRYDVKGASGRRVPLYLLDADLPENAPADRDLTSYLYGGDVRYRLAQEIILGIGGLRMLRALGYSRLRRFHMNEGHSALLPLELLRERYSGDGTKWDFDSIRQMCVFTTHTPVAAGHDQFPYNLVDRLLEPVVPRDLLQVLGGRERLNMTLLALNFSHWVNGVAKRHGVVSHEMFPGYAIHSITNGVHSRSWTCESFRKLFDRHIPGWADDPASLRSAVSIPREEAWAAHAEAKRQLVEVVNRWGHAPFREDAFTIGFARRATGYKRMDLVFSDIDRLAAIAQEKGPLQLVFAGKAHPQDESGKAAIRAVFERAEALRGRVAVAFLKNYDLELSRILTAGADLWLNTPLPPLEASGTSGMKAAHNGVPSLSVLDGWWVEGAMEGVTGWSIEPGKNEAGQLYDKLGRTIVPMFFRHRHHWIDVMRQTIAFNASFFNSHRMVQQYAAQAFV